MAQHPTTTHTATNDHTLAQHHAAQHHADNHAVAPCLQEIAVYIQEKGYNVDAKGFYDYYEVNDWKDIKGNKVKNWKQKVITWHNRSKKQLQAGSGSGAPEKIQAKLWGGSNHGKTI